MNDPIVVERGVQWPHACVVCGSQGPGLLDYGVEKMGLYADTPNMPAVAGGYGHVYLCKLCVKSGARVYGFSKGPRLDMLEGAADQLALKDKDIQGLEARAEQLVASIAERDRRITQLADRVSALESQRSTVEHLAGILSANSLELAKATS